LTVVMEMPGVDNQNVQVTVENDILSVNGRIDFSKYEGLQPVYTEYNVGHYARSFQLSSKIDQGKITADLKDGVITLTLPKSEEAKPRKITVG
jgi:HSP20 family protein